MKKVRWIFPAFAVVAVTVANLGGAWMGGTAKLTSLLATLLYVCAVPLFLLPGTTKLGFAWSLLTLASAAFSLIMRLLKQGFVISAMLSVFASVPFYGLRYWLDWTGVYAAGCAVGLCWLGICLISRKMENRM